MKIDYSNKQFLISSLKSGETDAYEYIYDTYYKALLSYIHRIVNNNAVAHDIVQEAFIGLWENRKKIMVSPVAFLYKSAYNKALNTVHHRRIVEKYETAMAKDIYFQKVIQRPEAELNLIENDFNKMIEIAKSKLPQRCREIFDMSRECEMCNSDIAKKLGISTKSVENQMTIAINRIKKNMKKILDGSLLLLILFWG
jgi:RNA polymerase sigma-70 factor (ECF subfamily)